MPARLAGGGLGRPGGAPWASRVERERSTAGAGGWLEPGRVEPVGAPPRAGAGIRETPKPAGGRRAWAGGGGVAPAGARARAPGPIVYRNRLHLV